MIRSLVVCALIFGALIVTATSATAQTRVQAGILQCRGAPTGSFIVGSVHQLGCVFQSDHGPRYRYYGVVRRVGLDIGFTEQSAPAWAVFASTNRIGPGDLSGNYGGVTAGGSIGIGGNASALVGGSNNELALQPLSFERQTGLNVAVGIAGLELHYVSGSLQKKRSTSQQTEREALFRQFLEWQKNQPVDHRPR
jgi:Protein of unknown function (DUF992)